MKFFDAIFKKKKEAETTANTSVSKSKEAQSLKELEGVLQKLQESDTILQEVNTTSRSENMQKQFHLCERWTRRICWWSFAVKTDCLRRMCVSCA